MHFGQWHEWREAGFFASPYRTVNDTNAFGQWHECRLLSVNHTQSITQMQIAKCNIHSALIPECDLDLVKFSWVWFTLSAFVSLTVSLTGFKLCHDITSGKVDQEEVVSDIFYSSILFPNLPPEVMRINSLITWFNVVWGGATSKAGSIRVSRLKFLLNLIFIAHFPPRNPKRVWAGFSPQRWEGKWGMGHRSSCRGHAAY